MTDTSRNLTMPGNPRYQPRSLQEHFGYDNTYRGLAQVEIANLRAMADIGMIPKETLAQLTPEVEAMLLNIRATDVTKTEREVTKHDVRAWILEAKKVTPPALGQYLHLMLTSYDALDTGRILQFHDAHRQAILPAFRKILGIMASLVREHAETLQIGRTHGQHALPITIGFWLATILNRVHGNLLAMNRYANELVGKISGAVGAYNAQLGMGAERNDGHATYETLVLSHLGLTPAPISTQILPPEPLAYYLHACVMMSAALAQFGRDCRHLMRTEIAEIGEDFSAQQSGSSTMAHKRNPITFEQLEGMYARIVGEFVKVLTTTVSEHQRDLTGSCVARDFPNIPIILMTQAEALLRPNKEGVPFLARIRVDKDTCARNFRKSSNVILSEPLYIALLLAGYDGDAHHLVNHELVPAALRSGRPLVEVAGDLAISDPAFSATWERVSPEVIELLWKPASYTGNAKAKALETAERTERYLETTAC